MLLVEPQRIAHAILASRLVLNVRWYAEQVELKEAVDCNLSELENLGVMQRGLRRQTASESKFLQKRHALISLIFVNM